jgi:hypothetical protein
MGAQGVKCFFDSNRGGDGARHGDVESAPGLGSPPAALLQRHGARVLYPADAASVRGWPAPQSTVYRARTLLVPGDLLQEPAIGPINRALARVGMRLVRPAPDREAPDGRAPDGRAAVGRAAVDDPAPGESPNGHGPGAARQLPRTAVLVPAPPAGSRWSTC